MPMNFGQTNVGGGWGPPPLNTELLKYYDEKARSGLSNMGNMLGGAIGGGISGMTNAKTAAAGGTVAPGSPMGFLAGAKEGFQENTPNGQGEEYKKLKDIGRASTTFMNAIGDDGYKKIGMSKEQFGTLSARDQGSAVAGMFKGMAMEELMQNQKMAAMKMQEGALNMDSTRLNMDSTRQAMAQRTEAMREQQAVNSDVAGFARTLGAPARARTEADWNGVYDNMLTQPGPMVPAEDRSRMTAQDIAAAVAQYPRALQHANPFISDIMRYQDGSKGTPTSVQVAYQKYREDYLALEQKRFEDKRASASAPLPAEVTAVPIKDPDGATIGHQVGGKNHFLGSDTMNVTTSALLISKQNSLALEQAKLAELVGWQEQNPGQTKRGWIDWLPGGTTVEATATEISNNIARLQTAISTLQHGGAKSQPAHAPGTNAPAKTGGTNLFEQFKTWNNATNKPAGNIKK